MALELAPITCKKSSNGSIILPMMAMEHTNPISYSRLFVFQMKLSTVLAHICCEFQF